MAAYKNKTYAYVVQNLSALALVCLAILLVPSLAYAHGGGGHGGGGGGGHCGGGGGHCGGHGFSGGHVGGFTGGHFGCGHSHSGTHFYGHGFSSSNSGLSSTSIFNSNINNSSLPVNVNSIPLPTDPDQAALGIGALTPEEELINQKAKRVGFFGHLHRMFRGGPTP